MCDHEELRQEVGGGLRHAGAIYGSYSSLVDEQQRHVFDDETPSKGYNGGRGGDSKTSVNAFRSRRCHVPCQSSSYRKCYSVTSEKSNESEQ